MPKQLKYFSTYEILKMIKYYLDIEKFFNCSRYHCYYFFKDVGIILNNQKYFIKKNDMEHFKCIELIIMFIRFNSGNLENFEFIYNFFKDCCEKGFKYGYSQRHKFLDVPKMKYFDSVLDLLLNKKYEEFYLIRFG